MRHKKTHLGMTRRALPSSLALPRRCGSAESWSSRHSGYCHIHLTHCARRAAISSRRDDTRVADSRRMNGRTRTNEIHTELGLRLPPTPVRRTAADISREHTERRNTLYQYRPQTVTH